jgi:serine/threonine protein kinase
MDILYDSERGLVTKRATTEAQRASLSREAAILKVVAHPGVVQLVGVEGEPPEHVVLRLVAGGDLSTWPHQTIEVVAGVGAALATVLADLHDIGVSHGAIEASHVLLDGEGRPVLCSFGRARRGLPSGPADVLRQGDVRALASLILDCCPESAPKRTVRALRLAAGSGGRRSVRSSYPASLGRVYPSSLARNPVAKLSGRTHQSQPGSPPHDAPPVAEPIRALRRNPHGGAGWPCAFAR